MESFSLFSTPLWVVDVPGADLAAQHLVPGLVAEARENPGITASNEGGTWHSVPDLAMRGDPAWDAVARMILGQVLAAFDAGSFDCAIQMWATVTPPGGYSVVHDHTGSHWSVALWLDAGDADFELHPRSGVIAFLDPRRVPPTVAGVELHPPVFSVRPRTGAMAIFPGWLQHFVHPYRGSRPRVCISANVQLTATGPRG
jgi:uncharacterized protein (TIGR02466 family)